FSKCGARRYPPRARRSRRRWWKRRRGGRKRSPGGEDYSSSSTEILSDRRNFLSRGVILMGAGSLFSTLKSKVETSAASRLPLLLKPMVASSTRDTSYPSALMRFRQCAIWGDSASVRWMVVPRSWTILLTSSLLAGSAFSIGSTRRNYAEEPRGVSSQPVGTENVEGFLSQGGHSHIITMGVRDPP